MTIGRCHICKASGIDIERCAACDHWFCARCRLDWFSRSVEAVKGLIKFQSLRAEAGKEKCCGPIGGEVSGE